MRGFFIGLLVCVLGALCWHIVCNKPLDTQQKWEQLQFQKGPELPKNQYLPVIEDINRINKGIQTFTTDASVEVTRKRTVKVNGPLMVEKPNNFRMKLSSILGEEVDVGSNSERLWYWSRRDKNPGLYYAPHDKINNTGLRTPFNPKWLLGSFNLSEIETKDIVIESYKEGLLRAVRKDVSPNQKNVTICIIIDPARKCVVGRCVYGENGQVAASTEIHSFQSVEGYQVPKVVVMNWYEENVRLRWTFSSTFINKQIDSKNWTMPDRSPKIDMSK